MSDSRMTLGAAANFALPHHPFASHHSAGHHSINHGGLAEAAALSSAFGAGGHSWPYATGYATSAGSSMPNGSPIEAFSGYHHLSAGNAYMDERSRHFANANAAATGLNNACGAFADPLRDFHQAMANSAVLSAGASNAFYPSPTGILGIYYFCLVTIKT